MKLYTIPATRSFVDDLARGILDRYGGDPLSLSALTVLLPNRRAARTLREAFLRLSGGAPLLLPAIRPLGDVEEESLYLGPSDPALAVPPAIDPLRRRLALARYLMAGRAEPFTTAQALAMAGQLGRFLDGVETEGLSLDALDTLVPSDYAAHWQISLEFLKDVLRVFWPQQLELEGVIDAPARTRRLIEAYTQSLRQAPPQTPVIAAGSTGSIPATADLLKTVAELPQGCVVLPGLDMLLEEDHWTGAVEEGHPQAGLARLLLHFGATRRDVRPWLETPADPCAREVFISALMRPPAAMESWTRAPLPKGAVDGITLLEADTLDEEATSIALMMREHVETAQTGPCVLVTPDRVLAGRVMRQLLRWNIVIDDSAGLPLAQTPVGAWLVLLCEVLENGLEPVSLLSLLKNAFAAGGPGWPDDAPPFRSFVRLLDRHVLRGPRPAEGFAPLLDRAAGHSGITAGLKVLEAMFKKTEAAQGSVSRLRALIHLAETLAATKDIPGENRLWSGEAGEMMAGALANLLEQADIMPTQNWADIRALLDTAMEGRTVRPRYGTHPRLAILGPMEARLYQAGRMILGSLNEGTWPRAPESDGWMSRAMRAKFGLPAPERAITLSAHDFTQGLGARHLVLTRSKHRDGTPTTPSRWLQRLDTLCAAQPVPPDLRAPAAPLLAMARALDAPAAEAAALTRPAPNPPLDARPKKLSVTEIAKWRRDPYYIYAKHILGLRPLDPIAMEPDAAERGTLIHEALMVFARKYPGDLPEDAEEQLIATGRAVFDKARQHPDVTGHWWPRFVRMARALIRHETAWRQETQQIYPEIKAAMTLPTARGDFILEGRADRIERRTTGWAVIDYKSGVAPSASKVKSGAEPQLPLLGHMLLAGDFNAALKPGATPDRLETLAYWKTGGGEDTLQTTVLPGPEDLCVQAHAGLASLVRAYTEEQRPYTCWPDAGNPLRPDYEYAHLARIAEWANADDINGGEDAS